MSRRDYERKMREEQEATAHVFQEFLSCFQDTATATKAFVKSEVLYADKNQLKPLEGELYKPSPLIKNTSAIKNALECAKILKEPNMEKVKKKERPKSNLELLKEELKQRHSERDERERIKEEIMMAGPAISYFDGGDPNSTNLFLSNLNPKLTEADLMENFGVYGPLASVKIMWPRGDDRFKNIDTNCGFVAYMSRKDAERALSHMKHRTDMRVGWGKSVDLPAHPVFIPQELLRLYLPPPPSGLPFNAQLSKEPLIGTEEDVLINATIKVTIPLNKKILGFVNRMVEFVVKEGPLFEAVIMNQELGNPDYSFLFDNKSPTHVYYRWKLFSVLQGDSIKQWRMEPFRMFKGGSIWLPPVAPSYSQGMPDHLIKSKTETQLSDNQCERFVEMIQNLSLSRNSVGEAMVFCFNHLSAIKDSFRILVESLCNDSTKPVSKIARFYLFSDVLSNCQTQKVALDNLDVITETVLSQLSNSYQILKNNFDKNMFKSKVMRVVHQLESIGVLKADAAIKFERSINADLGDPGDDENSSCDEPLSGANLRKRSLKNISEECVITPSVLKTRQEAKIKQEYFVPSKWDAVDPEEVEAQAMCSTKLYLMEVNDDKKTGTSRKRSPSTREQKNKKHKSRESPERNYLSDKTREKKKKSRRKS